MSIDQRRFCTSAVITGLVALSFMFVDTARADDTKPAPAADSPEALKEQIKSLKPPDFDAKRRDDAAYRKQYQEAAKKVMLQRAELMARFVQQYPDNADTTKMRNSRWAILTNVEEEPDDVVAETDAFLRQPGHEDDADVMAMNAHALLAREKPDLAKAQASVDRFVNANPKDERGASLLFELVRPEQTPDQRLANLNRIITQYPTSRTASYAKGHVRRNEQVGKPFELSFTDATTGRPVSIAELKGKVVVVDFWATWCGPCVAEMPKMKKLYAEYKPRGVEFVGVSLDQPESKGGLTALKEFAAKNEIPWPQYYQGKFWESEFSTGWGVNSIPCMFVLDADGNLVDAYAREKLEKLLPELIAKRDKQSADARR